MSFKQFSIIVGFLLLVVSISAQVPNTINYQGRLNDASGSPVADGAYLVKFIIYDAATAGTDVWNTGFQTINTVGGLFSYQLGSNVALPNGIFSDTNRYLGITVGTDPELTPRSRFVSSAYAFEAGNVAWSNISSMPAGFADGTDDGLSQLGDTLKGTLYFDGDNNGVGDGSIQLSGASTNLILRDNGIVKSTMWGASYGEINLFDISEMLTVRLYAGNTGGILTLADNTGVDRIRLYSDNTGNSSVQLPTDAIDNNEILDEPGITSHLQGYFKTLSSTSTMEDIVTTTITIPAPGYIFLYSKSYVVFQNSTSGNFASLQIDESAAGTSNSPYLTLVGDDTFSDNNQYFRSANCHRVYYKSSAGTYTFRVEGEKYYSTGADVSVYNSILTAIYIPTSYGTVSTVSTQPPTDAEATQVTMTNPDGSTSQGYKYDLRNLELKAKEAQLKAQQAEMELLKAQQRQSRNEQ